MRRLRAVVAYNGSGFHGFASQPKSRTVAGAINGALVNLFGQIDDFTCAGRTDAGVHALGQVIHFDVNEELLNRYELARVLRSLNSQLAPEIVFQTLEEADSQFNARFSARARRYEYTVFNGEFANPLLTQCSWWVADKLDLEMMNIAAQILIGEHDFSAFCRRPKNVENVSLVRNVKSASWKLNEQLVVFEIEANAFCHQMVRAIVGILVQVGVGKKKVDDVRLALESCDRAKASPLAPPQGLVLKEVKY